jgi:hypothetical protein
LNIIIRFNDDALSVEKSSVVDRAAQCLSSEELRAVLAKKCGKKDFI